MPALYLATDKTAGDEISSTYEGRHITLEESLLIHPYHADALVDKGDPVLFAVGSDYKVGVGVAFKSAILNTDLIAIDTEGIWFLNVMGSISDGSIDGAACALHAGDPVYINKTAGTVGSPYMLSGQDDANNWVPFGYLLGDVTAHLTTPTLVAVKVHWNLNYLESINVGSYSTPAGPVVIDNLEVDTSAAARARGEAGESWGIEYAWLKAYIGLSDPLHVDEDMSGIYVRLEDDKASTGGDLYAARFQTHVNNAGSALTRAYGLYVATSLEALTSITEVFGVAIAMGGGGGVAPDIQCAIQICGDGTMGTIQGWFDTEIGRGAGLKADATALPANRSFEIPIIINDVRYAIPVVVWT